MQTLTYDNTTYFLPESIEEVKDLFRQAKAAGQTIVLRGAGHSFPMADQLAQDETYLHVMLTYLNKITQLDWSTGLVTVQAGCHLGLDPYDPAGVSTEQNSLLWQLDPVNEKGQRTTPPGWAVPDLGGIIHQTMGGFSGTSSSGGSVKYAFEDAIVSVRIIYHGDSDVEDKTFVRPADNNPDDPFWGVAYGHLGLMGIMVEMTLQCEPAFNITGNETVSETTNCAVDLFGAGTGQKPSLQTFLTQTDYTRLLWWPQPDIDKIVLWQAQKQDARPGWKTFVPKPYEEVPYINNSPTLATAVSDAIFTLLDRASHGISHLLEKWLGHTPSQRHEIEEAVAKADDWLLKQLLKVFAKEGNVQQFQDIWWHSLPMDNQMSDKMMAVWFTELWIPLDRTQEVMNHLKEFYKDPLNAGTFSCELYAAKKSLFWMNPAYGTDVIRIDVFWFAKNAGDPTGYFERYWKAFASFDFRCHWGKYLPYPSGEQGVGYLQKNYPMWEKFMGLRQQMDPHGLLLNRYWSEHLGIPKAQTIKSTI
jgi:D-arabinono-1,4-lactone oxidase